ncbi:MAG: ATP-binding protein [Bacteroidota bacterium]
MKKELSIEELQLQNSELISRLEEAEQLIDAIREGEVDAFALRRNNQSQIFTLESGDHAYRMLVENMTEGAVSLSEDGLILYTNGYFHELLGASYEVVIGKPVLNFIHPDSREYFMELFRKGVAGQSKGEINLTSVNKIIPVYISLTSLYPTLQTVGMIISDLTERKKAEEEIKNKAVELERMNKELQSFAYISSHDLQEPLRKIQTFATRITQKESQNLSDNGKEMFHRMQLAAKRMQTLIEDLFAYSRTKVTERHFEKTDLNKIFEEVKEDLQDTLKEKNATIEVTELCYADIIPFQFRQMMHNLISNSLKFSSPQKTPHINIKGIIAAGKNLNNEKLSPRQVYCHITISDNGIGFEQQYSDRIFEVFQRLHSKSEYNGTGIGLSIVKKIVENHNGIITAQSDPGKGAQFDIFIPTT